MSIEYDPAVLQRFADNLYSRARFIALQYAVIYGALGWAAWIGVMIAYAFYRHTKGTAGDLDSSDVRMMIVIVSAIVGWFVGANKGFTLRLDAQRTLCQLQIEKNTRTKAVGAAN